MYLDFSPEDNWVYRDPKARQQIYLKSIYTTHSFQLEAVEGGTTTIHHHDDSSLN